MSKAPVSRDYLISSTEARLLSRRSVYDGGDRATARRLETRNDTYARVRIAAVRKRTLQSPASQRGGKDICQLIVFRLIRRIEARV